MFGNLLQDYEIEPLRKILNKELVNYPAKSQETAWTLANAVFQQWKLTHATKEGYTKNTLAALMGSPGSVSDEIFQQAEPWHCAGFGVRCRTDLAYKLWLENHLIFNELLDTVGFARLFAILAVREEPIHAGSIIRVTAMLMDMNISMFARYFEQSSRKERLRLEALAAGRRKGADSKRAKSEQKNKAMRDFARSYFVSFPTRTYDQVVRELLTKPYAEKSDGTRYAARRVRDIIEGTKDEALLAIEQKSAGR